MGFVVTTLMENHAAVDGMHTEHGLSLHLTDGSFSLLLDTGATPAFLDNARQLGVGLDRIDILVLSHGHYDHTGGVKALLESGCHPGATYFGPNFFARRYHREPGRLYPIGARLTEEFLFERAMPFYVLEPGILKLSEQVFLVCGIPFKTELEKANPGMLRQYEGAYVVDDFNDETVVVVRGEQGLALLSGCSHRGVVNTCMWVSELFREPVHTFIGGTHLMDADEARIRATMARLHALGVRRLGACHCNGEQAGAIFEREFEGFFKNNAGTVTAL